MTDARDFLSNFHGKLIFNDGFLRPLNAEDVHPSYVDGLNDPDVNRYLETKHTHQTSGTVTNFVINNRKSGDSILWGIWKESDVNHSGTVRLHGVNLDHGIAYIGICIFNKKIWGKGIGTKAIKIVTEWAITNLKLRWIEAGAFEDNLASQHAFLNADYEWVFDVKDKFLYEGKPTTVKIFARK